MTVLKEKLDKKFQHEIERHMIILSAPNFNLMNILKDSLSGGHNKKELDNFNSMAHLLYDRNIKDMSKRSSKFMPNASDHNVIKKLNEINLNTRSSNKKSSNKRDKTRYISNNDLKTVKINMNKDSKDNKDSNTNEITDSLVNINYSNNTKHSKKLENEVGQKFLNSLYVTKNEGRSSFLSNNSLNGSNQSGNISSKNTHNINCNNFNSNNKYNSSHNIINVKMNECSEFKILDSDRKKSLDVNSTKINPTIHIHETDETVNIKNNSGNKDKKEDRVKIKLDYDPKTLSHKLHLSNFKKYSRTLKKEIENINSKIDINTKETKDINNKGNVVAIEKIELIEETELLDAEINNILRQKYEIQNSNNTNNTNNTYSTEGNMNTVNSDPFSNTNSSTREVSKTTCNSSNINTNSNSNNSAHIPTNKDLKRENTLKTAPNQNVDFQKLKKIQELKLNYSNMEKKLEDAKKQVLENEVKNKKIIQMNHEMRISVQQKLIVIKKYESEINFMEEKLSDKRKNQFTPRKLIKSLTGFFKKKDK